MYRYTSTLYTADEREGVTSEQISNMDLKIGSRLLLIMPALSTNRVYPVTTTSKMSCILQYTCKYTAHVHCIVHVHIKVQV